MQLNKFVHISIVAKCMFLMPCHVIVLHTLANLKLICFNMLMLIKLSYTFLYQKCVLFVFVFLSSTECRYMYNDANFNQYYQCYLNK